jgi:hypothetical protein
MLMICRTRPKLDSFQYDFEVNCPADIEKRNSIHQKENNETDVG